MALEKLTALLSEWRAMEVQQLAPGLIREDPMYQPRNVRLAPFRDRSRLEDASEQHVSDMVGKLEAGSDLDPLLVGRIDGGLFLIDGHHRLKAYRRARRLSVPVRVRGTTRAEALMVSKMVNCDGAKLPLHRDQQRESAWQYLAAATSQGRRGLPEGESLRSIGGAFGVDKSTVGRMVKRLPRSPQLTTSPTPATPARAGHSGNTSGEMPAATGSPTCPRMSGSGIGMSEGRPRWQRSSKGTVVMPFSGP